MKFSVEHTFRGITLAEYERLYFDEDFNAALCAKVRLSRQVKKNERTDSSVSRIVKVGPDREIPKPVAKVLGVDRIEYEEHIDYRFGSFRGRWQTIPMVLPNKVKSEGTFAFTEVPGGVRRLVDGDIDVRILGIGSVIEKFIVSDVERSYEDAARFTQGYIDEGRHRSVGNA
jgi:hypothetical protein